MDPQTVKLLIPLASTALSAGLGAIAILAILQLRMAKIVRGKPNPSASETEKLREEVEMLRNAVHQQTILIDNLSQRLSLPPAPVEQLETDLTQRIS